MRSQEAQLATGAAAPVRARVGLVNAALRGVALASKFALIAFLARYLAPASLGVYGLFSATVAFGLQLLGLEVHQIGSRTLVHRPTSEWPAQLRDQLLIYVGAWALGLPIAALMCAKGLLPWFTVGWLLALLPLSHLGQELYRLLVVQGRPVHASVLFWIRGGAWCFVAIALMWRMPESRTLSTVFSSWALGEAIAIVFGLGWFASLPWREGLRTPVDRVWIRRAVTGALPFLAAALAARGLTTLDRFVIGKSWGDSALGIYVFFSGVVQALVSTLETGVVMVFLPRLIAHGKRGEDLQPMMRRFSRWLLVSAGGVLVAAAVAIRPLLAVARNPAYRSGMPVFWLLLLWVALTVVGWIPHYGLYARHRDRALVGAGLGGFAVVAALDFLLIPQWGARGAAVALAVGAAVAAILKQWFFLRGTSHGSDA